MKKIVLTAVAVLAITGSAFAGSDHYGSDGANQPAVTSTDSGHTASTEKSAPATQAPAQGSNRDLYGSR
jgi:hypothetical protein